MSPNVNGLYMYIHVYRLSLDSGFMEIQKCIDKKEPVIKCLCSSNILLQCQGCFCVGNVHVMNFKRDDAGPEEMSLVRLGIMSTCH